MVLELGEVGDMKGGKRRNRTNNRELYNDIEVMFCNDRGRND